MLRDQPAQLLDLPRDQGFETENVAFAEERAQGVPPPLVHIVMHGRADAAGDAQSPELIVVLVSAGRRGRRRVHGVEESDVVHVDLVWGDADDRTLEQK